MAHEDLPIPTFSSLDPVYGDGSPLEEAQLRIQALKSKFAELFGDQPDLFARSPGRVNLIGEGYSVLPMVIRQDTIIAIKNRSEEGDSKPVLRFGNVNDKYSMCEYPADPNQEIDLKNQMGALFYLCVQRIL